MGKSKGRGRKQLIPQGYVKSGFEPVWEAFKQSLDSGVEEGGCFAAYHQGELVVNVWGGWADKDALRLWRKDTAGIFFSTTKSLSSIVIAQLVDRGLLNYEDKISKHWPEFAENGKGDITLQTYISHRAGLAELTEPYQLSWLRDDPGHLCDVLARAKPLWKPGEHHGYHPMTFALYLDQVVRRVDPKHRSLAQYFDEEIATLFDLDLHIGMPKHLQYRVARLSVDVQQYKKYYKNMLTTTGSTRDMDIFKLTLQNPVELKAVRVMHDPDYMELPCGSSHGVGTVAAMAKFHGILAKGQDGPGCRIISPVATERLQVPMSWGADKTYGSEDIYGLGICLLPVAEGDEVHYMFGHTGFGGQIAAADSKHQVGFCYVTNFMKPTTSTGLDSKWLPLYNKLFECVLRVEGCNVERKTYTAFSDDAPGPFPTSKL